MRPHDCKFTETHEWVKLNSAKKEATLGITDHAVSQLSDLVHLDLPKVGEKIEKEEAFGEVESVKTVADLISPVSGKIFAVNTELAENLETLTEDPFGEGWLIKVKIEDPKELESLMTSKEYKEFIETSKEDDDEAGDEEEKPKKKGGDDEDDVDEGDFM